MSDEQSARLTLPFLQPGQAQKEMTHNEALARIDIAVQASATSLGTDTPPADAAPGRCWIVGDSPTGDWAGMAKTLAGWTADGWRFVAPLEGMAVWVADQGMAARFGGGAWQLGDLAGHHVVIDGIAVIGAQRAAIANPDGGTTIDPQARAGVGEILSVLRAHGLIAT